MENEALYAHLVQTALSAGAYRAGVVPVSKIVFDRGFRKLCEQNSCGNYGKCWMCPPDAGDIDVLMAKAKGFDAALVYQTVSPLEDSYDFEGMQAGGNRHQELAHKLADMLASEPFRTRLHLSAGGCRVCAVCAKRTNEPCRFPDQAMSSLETYGIAVSQLAELAGMKYINGQNTVTYFGAYFFTL